MNQKCHNYIKLFPIFLIFFSACQPARLPHITPGQPSEYIHFEDKNHFRVAVQPYTKKAVLEQYFGIDLLESSILPILVVLENGSDQAVILETSGFRISHGLIGKEATSPMEKERMLGNRAANTAFSIGALTVGPVLVFLAPFMVYHNNRMVEVSANINRQALTDRIIYQGEKHHGFIYLKLEGDLNKMRDDILTVDFKTLGSKRVLTFQFPIQMDRDDVQEREIKERRPANAE